MRTQVLINPGSGPLTEGTLEQAWVLAKDWLAMMEAHHVHDVQIVGEPEYDGKGRWAFVFEHKITGVHKILETHGLTDEQAKEYMFYPRTYWDGSSTGTPDPETFLAPGYRLQIVKDEEAA